MTRENKLALIISFSLVLVVAILVTDHLSPAHNDQLSTLVGPGNARTAASQNDTIELPRNVAGRTAEARANELGTVNATDSSGLPPIHHFLSTEPSIPTRRSITLGENATPPRNLQDRIHIVKRDQTMYSIATMYFGDGSLADELAVYNADRVPEDLRIRQYTVLRIPAREVLLGRSPPGNGSRQRPIAGTGAPARGGNDSRAARDLRPLFIDYTIQSGDMLSTLAQEHLGSAKRWREIYELNRGVISDPDLLIAGHTLRIPVR